MYPKWLIYQMKIFSCFGLLLRRNSMWKKIYRSVNLLWSFCTDGRGRTYLFCVAFISLCDMVCWLLMCNQECFSSSLFFSVFLFSVLWCGVMSGSVVCMKIHIKMVLWERLTGLVNTCAKCVNHSNQLPFKIKTTN